MFNALFKIILNFVATLLQIILLPINAIIEQFLPDVSNYIDTVIAVFSDIFGYMIYAIDILPTSFKTVMVAIAVMEIAKVSIYVGSNSIIKVWHLIQKIKFW